MEYKNDKSEFIAFAESGLSGKKSTSIDVCLERVTKVIDEEFLEARAKQYREDVQSDNELKAAFEKLAVICNEKKHKAWTFVDICIYNNYKY